MTDAEILAQALGTNDEAQTILREIITEKFPQIESQYGVTDQIIDKYYDWSFQFRYTTDGGSARRWRSMVRSYCARNPKLKTLNDYFNENDTDATFAEEYSGSDSDEFTDNRESTVTAGGTHKTARENDQTTTTEGSDDSTTTDNNARETIVKFSGIENTTGEATNTDTVVQPVDGKNTTETQRTTRNNDTVNGSEKVDVTDDTHETRGFTAGRNTTTTRRTRGTKRTYSDGRTWVQVMNDVQNAMSPVYEFVNGFSALLYPPCAERCTDIYTLPTMSARATAERTEGEAQATVQNVGSAIHGDFLFDFKIPTAIGPQGPQGERGPQGEQGEQGPEGPAGPAGPAGPQGPKGDTGDTGATGPQGATGAQGLQGAVGPAPDISATATVDGATGTPSVTVMKSGSDAAPNFSFEFTGLKGERGEQGPQGPQGPQGEPGSGGNVYMHTVDITHGVNVALRTLVIHLQDSSNPQLSIKTLPRNPNFIIRFFSSDDTPLNTVSALAQYLYSIPKCADGIVGYDSVQEKFIVRSINGKTVGWSKTAISGGTDMFLITSSAFNNLGAQSTVSDTVTKV